MRILDCIIFRDIKERKKLMRIVDCIIFRDIKERKKLKKWLLKPSEPEEYNT